MIKIENVETCNWRAAVRGCRNPLESWSKSDSYFEDMHAGDYTNLNEEFMNCVPDHIQDVYLGPNDLDLMKRLVNAGTDHSKFMRMITVSFDIVAPLYWWKEFDTYRIAVVRNSCSTMHKIEARHLTIDDFATDGLCVNDVEKCLQPTINYINDLIKVYKETSGDKLSIHRCIVKLLPDSYLQRATITTNYQVLRNIRNSDRKTHKLLEWREDFMKFIDGLPYAEELLLTEETRLERNRKISCEDCICHYTDLEGNSKSCESFSKYYDQHGWHCVCNKKKYSATQNSEVYSFEPKDFHFKEEK